MQVFYYSRMSHEPEQRRIEGAVRARARVGTEGICSGLREACALWACRVTHQNNEGAGRKSCSPSTPDPHQGQQDGDCSGSPWGSQGWLGVAGAAGPPGVPPVSWRRRLTRQKQAVIIPGWQLTGLWPGFTGQNVFSTSAHEWLYFPFFSFLQIYKCAGCFPLAPHERGTVTSARQQSWLGLSSTGAAVLGPAIALLSWRSLIFE